MKGGLCKKGLSLREVPVLLLVSARFSVNEIFSVYCFDIKDWVVIPYSLFKERSSFPFPFRLLDGSGRKS